MITYHKNKNIWDYSADWRICTVNCVGVMGKGIALDFKKRYPEYFKQYKKLCDQNIVYPGLFDIANTHVLNSINGKDTYLISMATKDHWQNPSKIEWIYNALRMMKYCLDTETAFPINSKIVNIALPAPGCGNGGLDFEKQVQPLIERIFKNTKHNLMVFHG